MGPTDPIAVRRALAPARVAFVAVGIALLAVGAWGATGDADTSLRVPRSSASDAVLTDSLLIAAGASVSASLIYVARILRHSRGARQTLRRSSDRRVQWLRALLGTAVILAAATGGLLMSRTDQQPAQPDPAAPPTSVEERPGRSTGEGAEGWTALSLVIGGAVAVVAGAVWSNRRWRKERRGAADELSPPPARADVRDLEALDPPEAIRSAYASARGAIASLGVAARASETPAEYLDRVREGAPSVQRPATTLTRLFELVRFSHHRVTVAMKADALAAHAAVVAEVEHEDAGQAT